MQTSYSNAPPIGRVGALADSRLFRHILSRIAEGTIEIGRSVFRVPVYGGEGQNAEHGPGMVYQQPSPAIAVDVDAILASGGATAVTAQVFEGTELNGVVGTGVMSPARKITAVLSSNANWDATTAVLTGETEDGEIVTENMTIPDGGNTTLTTTGTYRRVISWALPAQSGAGGTFTLGIAVLDTVTIADWEGVAMFTPFEGGQLVPDANGEIQDGETLAVMRKGSIWVVTEDACAPGGDVYTRVGGTGQMGAFRSDADGGNAVQIPGARWERASAANGLNKLAMY